MVAQYSVESATRHVAAILIPGLAELSDSLWGRITAARPSLVPSAPTALKLAHAACHATNSSLIEMLARGGTVEEMVPMTEVILATRALVQSGLSEEDVMTGYRLGATFWCENWANAVDEHCPDASLSVRVASFGTTFALGWLEMISGQVSAEHRDEAERLVREGSLARAAYVRRALSDDNFDVKAGSRDLGYNIAGRHVALVVSRYEGSHTDAPLDSIARALASELTSLVPLIVRIDLDTTLCWIPIQGARVASAPKAPVLIGQGRPGSGLDGFRRSHREACEAVRVAQLARRPPGTVTHFNDIELAALCSNDADFCRTFVADTLGPLAADDPETGRLRATLEAFFALNSNFRATAARLGIHHNTVRYRLERASALLGRAPEGDRLQLELALHLANRIGVSAEQAEAAPGDRPRSSKPLVHHAAVLARAARPGA
jgi:hypothetical protein